MRVDFATDLASGHDQQLRRRYVLSNLVNRLIVQLQTGCGQLDCPTPTCFSCRSRLSPQHARRYNTVTARAIAVELASCRNPLRYLCPNLSDVNVSEATLDTQEKTDPKSLVQQLFNTNAFMTFLQDGHLMSRGHKAISQYSSAASSGVAEQTVTQLSCDELISIKANLRDLKFDANATQAKRSLATAGGKEMYASTQQKLLGILSSHDYLSRSFRDRPLEIRSTVTTHDLPATRLDHAFRGWPHDYQVLIFDSIWRALGPLSESSILSTSSELDHLISNVAISTLRALTASIPRAQRDTWHVVLSTIVNGRAYGKQRYRKSDMYTSPWLHVLDAFESEPALRLLSRLVTIIAARDCVEACVPDNETHGQTYPNHAQGVRHKLLASLIQEEKAVRNAKYGDLLRDDVLHGKSVLGTTSLLWLEWLRKLFLKHWDGSFRIHRKGISGAALELMEDIWKNRGKAELDLPDDLFPTPVVFNNLNIDKTAVDWLDYQDEHNTRHILSFQFLFSTRSLTLLFRMVNHITMRRAHCGASAAQKMRSKAMSRASLRDTAYLDQRMKTAQEPYLVLKINRHSVLSDAYDQIWHRLRGELARPLRVRMGIDEGEIGHDLGGVQIEFFKLACAEAMDPNYSLFSIDSNTRLAWFKPASMVPLYKYQLFGVLFALAIYNGVTLPVSFPLVFYRKLLGGGFHDSDLREGWPDLAKALEDLCNYDGSVEDDLARDYTFSFTANGLYVETDMADPWTTPPPNISASSSENIELGKMEILNYYPDKHHPERTRSKSQNPSHGPDSMPEPEASETDNLQFIRDAQSFDWPGWEVKIAESTESAPAVTNANRNTYIHDYTHWMLDYSIRPQYSSFAKGFESVLDIKALSILTPGTLRMLVEGHKHLDIVMLQRAATYRGYTPDSEIVQWFWEVVKNYPEEKQKNLLEFVTASSRVPVNGAESLTFVIEKLTGDTDSLPGSSTCFSTLRLPEYENRDVLQRKLDIALQHSLGFGQA